MKIFKSYNLVWIFLAIVLVVQSLFVYGVANGILPSGYYASGRFYLLLMLAIGFTLFTGGVSAVTSLFRPLLVWKVSPWWYLSAVFWLVIFAIAVLFVKNLVIGEGVKAIPLTFGIFSNFGLLKGIVVTSIIEEIVWVGLVLTLLQKKFSWFVSSQILAVFWYLWWLPVIMYGKGVVPDLPLSILWFHYLVIAATCAWVYYFTKSGLVVALMQMLTSTVSLIVPILPHLSDMPTYITFIIGKFLVVVLLFSIFGPRPFFRKTNAVISA